MVLRYAVDAVKKYMKNTICELMRPLGMKSV